MKIEELFQAGTSPWLDDLSRSNIDDGTEKSLLSRIKRREIFGVTTNPTIFASAITKDGSYQADIKANSNLSTEEIVFKMAADDVRRACKAFSQIYKETNGVDGRVSIEVDPRLAHDANETVKQAKILWKQIGEENLMIKVPATKNGLAAFSELIAFGISVNVTLIFSLERYSEVIDAYLAGIKENSQPEKVHSVASFFISRLDTAIDPLLKNLSLAGKAAIANASLAYEIFQNRFADIDTRFNLQRPLWASTGVKNPAYPDTKYVEELIAPNTVNTMPPTTLDAFINHGKVKTGSIAKNMKGAKQIFADLEVDGIDLNSITQELENDGIAKFEKSWIDLLETVESQRK